MGKICIRVDGNEIIATGHIMRCLSVAEQLRHRGVLVEFVLADLRPSAIIKEKGFDYVALDSIWNDMNSEIEAFSQYINSNEIKTVLLDSYFVTEEYLMALAKIVNICYIDDLDKFIYPVHTLINYSLLWDKNYPSRYDEAGYKTRFLLGSKYVPLREEFAYTPYEVKGNVERVLITTGGTDQLNMACKLLEVFLSEPRLKDLEYNVIVGRFNSNKDELINIAENNPRILLRENVTDMSYWMRKCDVAITAAGTTTFELSACGIPSICFEVADNQAGAKAWQQGGYMIYAGNAYMDQDSCLKQCQAGLVSLCDDYNIRKDMSQKMQNLIDGQGADRIADYLIKLSEG